MLIPGRKFRCDFVSRQDKIVVEIEGGIYQARGRHVQGAGYAQDAEKYNMLTVAGWRVLRYCNIAQMRQFEANYWEIVMYDKGVRYAKNIY